MPNKPIPWTYNLMEPDRMMDMGQDGITLNMMGGLLDVSPTLMAL